MIRNYFKIAWRTIGKNLEGREQKMFIEANPQFKTLNLYDSKMEKQFQGIEKKEKQEPEQSKEKKEMRKHDVEEEGEGKKERKSKGKRVGV